MNITLAGGSMVAFLVAFAVVALLRRSPLAPMLADRPNERSLHEVPRPRVGGIGLLAGALPVALACGLSGGGWIVAMAALLALVSLADDARSLPVVVRLAAHLVASVVAVAAIAPPGWPASANDWPVAAAVLIAILWMTNLFNFMDGADGLAGAMAAIGFAALAVAAHRAGAAELTAFASAISAASLAFLAFNVPPSRVFLGDAGSVPLGFLAGALGWHGASHVVWPAWFPVLVFSPFIADATMTLLRRALAREVIWKAHRSHYYQRLVLGGWSHRRLAFAAWILMGTAAVLALVALEGGEMLRRGILAGWMLALCAIGIFIDRRRPRSRAS